ncbi:MAG: hypothetical protein H0V01_03490 [Bacteroidetes bacterium]|nr:hypothetical protein [Bacteroidota bacterium]HET6245549.1 hypothetical protein [Bacteroidia bacterium]
MKKLTISGVLILVLGFHFNSFAQKDNSFKIIVSMTGLGASYEYNPAGILYVEGGLTTAFRASRLNIQSKMALYKRDDFKIKFGIEGAYIIGNVDVGSVYIDYDRFSNIIFMPVISFESKVLGIQIPVFIDRSFTYIFPIVGITLNVTKDDPAKRVKKTKSKKDFDKQNKKLEKARKDQEEMESEN